MKHSLKGQMQIIAHAKTVIDTVGMPDELKASLKDGLDDAYSTIAALNLNPNIFERTKALEEALKMSRQYVFAWKLKDIQPLLGEDLEADLAKIDQLLNSKP